MKIIKRTFGIALAVFAMSLSLPAFAADSASMIFQNSFSEITSGTGMAIAFGGILINKENLTTAFITIKTLFNNAFDAAPSDWDKTAMLVPSTSSENKYNWLSSFPKMRKWLGDKQVKALAAFGYSIVNDDFEATVEVDRNDIDDDNLGLYKPQAEMAGYSAKQLPDEIVADLKNDAFTTLCYDGQFFYDTDHPVEDGDGNEASVSNKSTVVLSNATLAAADACIGAARIAISTVTDNQGRPLNLNGNVLEVPPQLETIALMLANNDKLADDKPNPYKGTFTVLKNSRLTSATQWMLHDTMQPVKPFIYQERKKPVFVEQTDMSADDVFNRKMYKFGAEARAAGGYAFWQMSFGSTGTG